MRARTVSASLLVAVAMIAAPAVAVADTGPGSHGGAGHSRSQAAKARAAAHRLEVQARSHRSFVLGGTVTAVQAPVVATDLVPAAPGTLTFVVHGGRWKVLRGATVTVTVAPDAKVTRGGVVDLTAVLPGDHVVVKSHQVDVTTVAPLVAGDPVTFTVTAVAHRVAAAPPETTALPAPATTPESEVPAPTS